MTRLRRAVAVGAALVVLGACGGDSPKLAEPKTTGTSTTVPTRLTEPSSPGGLDGATTIKSKTKTTSGDNSVDPDVYSDYGDYDNGRHAGKVKSFDGTRVGIDVVQFLTGDEAKQAYAQDTGNTDGPDNDYYVRNQSKTVRTLPVDRDVVIRVNNTGGYPPSDPDKGHQVSIETFQGYFDRGATGDNIFWFTIEDGLVISIEEQYVP